nr:Chain C, FIBRINOGEN [Homo sapiens]
LGGAKQAGDV